MPDLLALTGMIGREQPAAWLKTSDILADYVTKYPHTFPVMRRYRPEGLPCCFCKPAAGKKVGELCEALVSGRQ